MCLQPRLCIGRGISLAQHSWSMLVVSVRVQYVWALLLMQSMLHPGMRSMFVSFEPCVWAVVLTIFQTQIAVLVLSGDHACFLQAAPGSDLGRPTAESKSSQFERRGRCHHQPYGICTCASWRGYLAPGSVCVYSVVYPFSHSLLKLSCINSFVRLAHCTLQKKNRDVSLIYNFL